MGSIGDSMSSTPIPAVGSSGTDYATKIDALLTEIVARLEVDVPRGSLAAGTLDMVANPITNVTYLEIDNGSGVPTTPVNSFQAYGGNIYWVNTGGAVQLSSGAFLGTGGAARQQWIGPTHTESAGSVTNPTPGTPLYQVQASTTVYFPIHCVNNNERLATCVIKNSAIVANATVSLVQTTDTTHAFSAVTGASATVTAGAGGYTTLTPSVPALLTNGVYWLKIVTIAGGTYNVSSVTVTVS